MTIKELIEKTGWKLSTPTLDTGIEINGAYCGDLLSWVMGNGEPQQAWITVQVHAAGFFCKHGGKAKAACHRVGNGNAGGFHSENTGHPFVFEMLIKSIADLLQKRNIHLVVEETVYLEDASRADAALPANTFFQQSAHFCAFAALCSSPMHFAKSAMHHQS